MTIGWKHLVAALASILIGGIVIAWLGVIDIRASSGHWRATDWFLHFVMRSSVRTSAIGVEVPDLGNPAYLPLAAGHYEAACADCHGSPERGRSPAVLAMLPPPPDLKGVVREWSDAELFQIVRHGVRYTGMPAWPTANRDDEVWAMVAFLRRYPEIDAKAYHRLRGAREPTSAAEPDERVEGCDACHASMRLDGSSLIPRLNGQSETYLVESLEAFRDGRRSSGIMQTAVAALDDTDIAGLAKVYADRPMEDRRTAQPPALVVSGDAARKIPACSTCHDKPGLNPAFPKLSGLSRNYIRNQLKLFVAGARGGTAYRELMYRAVRSLTEQDIEALAEHYGR
ncbi:c-type cytochrome [Rhizobium sp. TH2]|uniref:c-type cytochrome n=1 Tax=Rhizobium sp. TH2 TaxID=2775403 RepID=UPI002158588C|nr:c-type cytochrome [Rhizobium sp. TH2]UVC08548.1 c-type cytochrome [Rhizobium sp. TH2]